MEWNYLSINKKKLFSVFLCIYIILDVFLQNARNRAVETETSRPSVRAATYSTWCALAETRL